MTTVLMLFAACRTPRKTLESALAAPTPLVSVPFDLYNNHIYVRAIINGDSAWLVLDTGDPHTLLDSAWALGIGALPFGKLDQFTEARVDSIALGELRLRNYRVDLAQTDLISQASGRPIRGLLGAEVLRRFTVEIDPGERRVKLYDPATYWYSGPGTVVSMVPRRGVVVARARLKISGGRTVKANLVLDTGASRECLIFSRRFVSRHAQLDRLRNVESVVGVGLRGQFNGRIVRVEELRLGPFLARGPTAGLPDSGTERILDIAEDGVVGNQMLSRIGVVFDYARDRMILSKAGMDAADCPYDMSGIAFTTTGPSLTGLRVIAVAPTSPAAEAGIVIGDEILAVDGRSASDLTLWEVRQALMVAGAKRELLVRRGADSIAVTLVLRPLL
ncbi:MAG TPA: PDZ domain-containing protein [Gemmatimonadales bacterium]|jgi:hypothetical protein|nr:PDZ domain-containing protein [Gemmatimonadales bacterium]